MKLHAALFDEDFRLKGQLRGSSLSMMSNIAEGFCRRHPFGEYEITKQFIRYLNIAKGLSGELRSQLYVTMDAKYIKSIKMNDLKHQATSISKQCAGLIKYLKGYDQENNVVKEFDDENFLEIITEFYED